MTGVTMTKTLASLGTKNLRNPMPRFSMRRPSIRRPSMRRPVLLLSLVFASIFTHAQTAKPKLTLDEFFNSVSFDAVKISPDGNGIVIGTEIADWDQQI